MKDESREEQINRVANKMISNVFESIHKSEGLKMTKELSNEINKAAKKLISDLSKEK